MKGSLLSSQEWCDIVFDGRRCDYGAYELRSGKGRRYMRALLVMVEIFLLVCDIVILCGAFRVYRQHMVMKEAVTELKEMMQERDKEVKYVAAGRRAEAGTTPDPQKDIPDISDTEAIVQMLGIEGPDDSKLYFETDIRDLAIDHHRDEELIAEGVHIIETQLIDGKPEFIHGGDKGFTRWIDEHCTYPNDAVKSKLQGEIVVTFIVDTEGRVVDIALEKRCNSVLLNGIVLEAMALMQKEVMWKPGVRNGVKTCCKIRVPIVYQLQ